MARVLIIGAGAVGSVVAHKCAQAAETFGEIMLASRTKSKCDAIAKQLKRPIRTAQVDADNVAETAALIRSFKPDLVMNIALPYQDLHIMDACLETGVNYLDTANYEPLDTAKFEYKWQWAYQERFKAKGLMALLGCGFDPGQTNIYTAHAAKHHFDEIHTLDILDCNGGDHGYPFATNFNPEINIREVSAKGRYWENGQWIETEPMAIKRAFDFDQVGPKNMYLLYHEELESLAKHYPTCKRMRFWMTFGDSYLTHLRCLMNVGMTRIDPVEFQGQQIVPIQFLKALLPDPGSLGPRTKGKTNIGCIITGVKDGRKRVYYVWNVCDHQECYREVGSQGVAYTTGVPAMLGGKLMLEGKWKGTGVYNVEQLDPDPFMKEIGTWGLPWQETFLDEAFLKKNGLE
jgi:saccharopine dehydrogenase (NAD+, L-lysine-forming)